MGRHTVLEGFVQLFVGNIDNDIGKFCHLSISFYFSCANSFKTS